MNLGNPTNGEGEMTVVSREPSVDIRDMAG